MQHQICLYRDFETFLLDTARLETFIFGFFSYLYLILSNIFLWLEHKDVASG